MTRIAHFALVQARPQISLTIFFSKFFEVAFVASQLLRGLHRMLGFNFKKSWLLSWWCIVYIIHTACAFEVMRLFETICKMEILFFHAWVKKRKLIPDFLFSGFWRPFHNSQTSEQSEQRLAFQRVQPTILSIITYVICHACKQNNSFLQRKLIRIYPIDV